MDLKNVKENLFAYLPLMWCHFRRGCRPRVLSICYLDKGCGPPFVFRHLRKRCNILREIQRILARIDKIRYRFARAQKKKKKYQEQKWRVYYWEKLFVWKNSCCASFRGCNRESLSIIFLRQKAARNRVFSHVSNLIVRLSITRAILNNRRNLTAISKSRSNSIFLSIN